MYLHIYIYIYDMYAYEESRKHVVKVAQQWLNFYCGTFAQKKIRI